MDLLMSLSATEPLRANNVRLQPSNRQESHYHELLIKWDSSYPSVSELNPLNAVGFRTMTSL